MVKGNDVGGINLVGDEKSGGGFGEDEFDMGFNGDFGEFSERKPMKERREEEQFERLVGY